MKSVKFGGTPNKVERIRVAVDPDFKAKVFEIAARRGVEASELIRQAIRAEISEPQAA